jgi:two-component system sensor histidine kinase KdpD
MTILPTESRRIVLQTVPGVLAVALITFICFPAERLIIPSLLYLIVVVLESLWGGFLCSAIVSVFAAACLEYFFIPPVLQWQIDDPDDILALLTYLATSLVITRLASRAKDQARAAERRRKDVSILYEAASRLLSLGPEMAAGPESLRIFRDVFGLQAACLFDLESGHLQIEGSSIRGLALRTRSACNLGRDDQDTERDLYIRCLYTAGRITGAVGFEGRIEDNSVALALSLLAATAVERMHSFRNAGKAAAAAQAEMLRSAILDAFAHEFKTPLAIILAAAGGLRETRTPLSVTVGARSAQPGKELEMTEIIEDQTLRLSQLTTRLLRMARLDRDDVSPQMEPTGIVALVKRLVDHCSKQFGRAISAVLPDRDAEILADAELLSLSMTQLVDNACKYSTPGSTIAVHLELSSEWADVSVSNEGSSVPPAERERIFERFFRGAETEGTTAGAGLGLYVARKIVRAHGGSLHLVRDDSSPVRTTFRIRLPLRPQDKPVHEEPTQGMNDERQAYQSVGS